MEQKRKPSTTNHLAKIIILMILSCIATDPVIGLTLTGHVYDEELKEINDVVIEVNTTPQQRYVSKDGTYSFSLPEGTYEIKARYSPDEYHTYKSSDIVQVSEKGVSERGEFVFDLFLFPDFEEDLELLEETGELELDGEEGVIPEERKEIGMTAIITAMLILFAILIIAYYWRRKLEKKELKEINRGIKESRKRAKEHPADEKVKKVLKEMEHKEKMEKDEKLATETQIIIDILKKEGGRATQKQVRKQIPLSEAKVSLMISELEATGKIKKVKKGRGNILILQ